MNPEDPRRLEVFFDVHSRLPREGPGNRSCTERALRLAGGLPRGARVLDIASGPGMQTLDLALLMPSAKIWAIDRHAPFVAEAKRRITDAGLSERVACLLADMRSLPFDPDTFDLVWCEGAAYIMGVESALRAWRALLKQGGALAFSDAAWLRDDPPARLLNWWSQGYPGMLNIAGCRRLVEECGYRLLGDFVLPEAAWWDDYYAPMGKRLENLRPKYRGDSVAMTVLAECDEEIDYYRRYSAYYGYLFVVATPAT